MAVDLPHPELLSQNYTEEKTFNVLETQYGDGYSQRALNGINFENVNLSLAWENIPLDTANTIEAALLNSLYSALTFNQINYFVTGYSVTAKSGELKTVSANVKRIYP